MTEVSSKTKTMLGVAQVESNERTKRGRTRKGPAEFRAFDSCIVHNNSTNTRDRCSRIHSRKRCNNDDACTVKQSVYSGTRSTLHSRITGC